MSLIQTPWTSQPPIGTQVNAAKAKDIGVIYLAVANEAGQLRDVIGGGTLTNPGGSSIGQGGRIWTFNGAQQGNKAFTLPNGETNPNNFLICAKIRATASQAGTPGAAFGIYASSNQSGCGVGFNSSNQVGTAWLSNAGAGIQAYSTASLNTWYSVYSNTQIGGGYYSWINGVPATTGQGGGVSNFFGGQDEIAVGAQYRSSGFLRNFTGDIEWAAIIYRPEAQITDDFSARLYRDGFPYNVFQPLPRRIFVPVSAATGDGTGTGSFYDVTLSSPTGTATGTGAVNGTGTGALSSASLSAPSATATGSALATGALTTVTLTTITASATGSALATGSLDAIDLSTVSGTATGTTAGNATGVGAVATIALSAPSASAVGSALATGGFAHVSLSAVSGTASAATNGQATADLQTISISAPLAIAIASSVATGGIQSIGLTAPNASATGQAQTIARPSADTINSGWTPSTGSDLYAMLDEVSPNDADYISTASAGSVCRLGLGAVADPGTSSGQVVSYRASSSTGNGLKVELLQGGTVIATWNHATLPATDTTYQQSLSAAECDAVTDYTALSVRLTSL